LPELSHTAEFSPTDDSAAILTDLACPACGHQGPGPASGGIMDDKLRMFCDCCGAFVTITLNEEQARAIRRRSETRSAFSDRPAPLARRGPIW